MVFPHYTSLRETNLIPLSPHTVTAVNEHLWRERREGRKPERMGAGRGEKKHREQGWPQDPAHMAGKEKQGGHLWVERWGTPHTLLHCILPSTLYDGYYYSHFAHKEPRLREFKVAHFLLHARHCVKCFPWIIFLNPYNCLSWAPLSPFYKEIILERQNHLPDHTYLIRGASGIWTQAGPSHPTSRLFTLSGKEVVLYDPGSLAFSVIPYCRGRICLKHRKRKVSQGRT